MEQELIAITEYCIKYDIEPSFISSLEESGIIILTNVGEEKFINAGQLTEINRYVHFHYDLHINVEGIDAIRHLLEKVNQMQQEIHQLRNQLHIHQL
ncbi:MAG: chaperone modulator CbpM [Candidatus Pedobacter colombiensis]|uniref:Chaperone modulator CbpM n=1 Tax=Candidatus Pedobacter colombiensis TaxID=3121371 RepID=A0AAJ6B796_9SPHI|nr:chaperone modulator CbpM [Pedobacter sp.]WEK20867.1 MAG: chaperone modulator CbpM [Pedobacter sp.]